MRATCDNVIGFIIALNNNSSTDLLNGFDAPHCTHQKFIGALLVQVTSRCVLVAFAESHFYLVKCDAVAEQFSWDQLKPGIVCVPVDPPGKHQGW